MFKDYKKFCKIREKAKINDIIDLSDTTFLRPTTILPLHIFQKKNKFNINYSHDEDFNTYYQTVTGQKQSGKKYKDSYLKITPLPEKSKMEKAFKDIYTILGNFKDLTNNQNAFNYFIEELVLNIYDHSNFDNGYFFLQKYQNDTEIVILDDGISIPGSFGKMTEVSDVNLLKEALNGKSSKKSDQRGRGLGTSFNMITKGFKGSILLVSRYAAIENTQKTKNIYKLSDSNIFQGTIISIRIPNDTKISRKEFYELIQI